MPRCAGTKADGSPCERITNATQRYCFAHDPATAEQRSRNASKAARNKPSREVAGIKAEVRSLIADVRAGALDRNNAAVMFQGYRVLKDLVELERRVKTTEELAAEIELLKERLDGQRQAW